MKGFLQIIVLFTSTVLLLTCSTPGADQAARYNDVIVDEILEANQALGSFYRSPDPDEAQLYEVSSKIHASIERLQNLKPIEKESDLKQHGLNLLGFYKGLVEKENKELLALLHESPYTPGDSIQIVQLLTQIVKLEKRYNDAFEEDQEVFADDFNIVLVRK